MIELGSKFKEIQLFLFPLLKGLCEKKGWKLNLLSKVNDVLLFYLKTNWVENMLSIYIYIYIYKACIPNFHTQKHLNLLLLD